MADLQPPIRQTPDQVRENTAPAVHASRNAGPLAQIWKLRWVQTGAFALGVGLFLSFIAAFGTADVPFMRRTAIFLAYALYGGVLGALVSAWSRRQNWITARPGLRPVIVTLIMTVLMAASIGVSLSVFAPGLMTLARLFSLIATSLVMSAVITGIAFSIFREQRMTYAAPAGAPETKFLARLPAKLRGGEVWALEAEDHYLRLHTSKGEDLILMRLSDAIGELDGIEGAQVHRSWWVARAAAHEVKRAGGKVALVLPSGKEAPVSRTYLRPLREAGWL